MATAFGMLTPSGSGKGKSGGQGATAGGGGGGGGQNPNSQAYQQAFNYLKQQGQQLFAPNSTSTLASQTPEATPAPLNGLDAWGTPVADGTAGSALGAGSAAADAAAGMGAADAAGGGSALAGLAGW